MIKTIGLFLLNKVLELFYHVITPLVNKVLLPFVFVVLCIIVLFVLFDLVGFILIGLLSVCGFDSIVQFWFVTIYKPDAPLYLRGVAVGFPISVLVGLVLCIAHDLKDRGINFNVKGMFKTFGSFIKSNWELAKAGKIYKP